MNSKRDHSYKVGEVVKLNKTSMSRIFSVSSEVLFVITRKLQDDIGEFSYILSLIAPYGLISNKHPYSGFKVHEKNLDLVFEAYSDEALYHFKKITYLSKDKSVDDFPKFLFSIFKKIIIAKNKNDKELSKEMFKYYKEPKETVVEFFLNLSVSNDEIEALLLNNDDVEIKRYYRLKEKNVNKYMDYPHDDSEHYYYSTISNDVSNYYINKYIRKDKSSQIIVESEIRKMNHYLENLNKYKENKDSEGIEETKKILEEIRKNLISLEYFSYSTN